MRKTVPQVGFKMIVLFVFHCNLFAVSIIVSQMGGGGGGGRWKKTGPL